MKLEMTTHVPVLVALAVAGCTPAAAQSGPSRTPAVVDAGPRATAPTAAPTAGRIAIAVGPEGYQPSSVTVPAGRPVTLVFTRTSDRGCGHTVVFPTLGLRRDLPLNQPVEIVVTPAAGTLTFTCGMEMLRGTIVAQ